jgi:hypothetical protein
LLYQVGGGGGDAPWSEAGCCCCCSLLLACWRALSLDAQRTATLVFSLVGARHSFGDRILPLLSCQQSELDFAGIFRLKFPDFTEFESFDSCFAREWKLLTDYSSCTAVF